MRTTQGELHLRLVREASVLIGNDYYGHYLDNYYWIYRGVIAKFIMPGSNEPSGFMLTTILGIIGGFVASYLGQALGWYTSGEGAGLVGAVIGAIIVLLVWSMVSKRMA